MILTSGAVFRAVFCLALTTGIFCLGAVYNRFPVFYADSIAYLYSARFFEFQGDRPVFYSLWLAAGHTIFPTYWFGVVAQSFLTALLLRWVMQAHGIRRLNSFHLLVCAVLALVTGICWQTGRLLPDALTAPMILSFYLLVFCHRKIGSAREDSVSVILMFSLAVHYSHLMILLIALCLLWVGYRARGKRLFPNASWVLAYCVLAIIPLMAIANYSVGLRYLYSRNSYAFLAARMVEDGSVAKFLEKNCGQKEYIFCHDRAYVTNQNVAGFLWGERGPFRTAIAQPREYRELVLGVIGSDPWGQLKSGLREFGRQLVTFGSADSLDKFSESGWEFGNLRRSSSEEAASFQRSRQQAGELAGLVYKLNNIYYLFFWLASFGLLGFCATRAIDLAQERALAVTIASFLLGNALVCGVFSIVADRYQARVAWLPVFAALLILARWLDRRIPA